MDRAIVTDSGFYPTIPSVPKKNDREHHSLRKVHRKELMGRIEKQISRCRTPSLERMLGILNIPSQKHIPSLHKNKENYNMRQPLNVIAHNSQINQSQLFEVFQFLDTDKSGYIERSEIVSAIRQLGMDVEPDTLAQTMINTPEALNFDEFIQAFSSLGLITNLVDGTLDHMNKTIIRAKNLGVEMQTKTSLDTQLTNLFHMQNHYRMIGEAKPSVDSWHYGPQSKCYHSFTMTNPNWIFKKNRRWLPMERMHMILTHSNEYPIGKDFKDFVPHSPSPRGAQCKKGQRPANMAQTFYQSSVVDALVAGIDIIQPPEEKEKFATTDDSGLDMNDCKNDNTNRKSTKTSITSSALSSRSGLSGDGHRAKSMIVPATRKSTSSINNGRQSIRRASFNQKVNFSVDSNSKDMSFGNDGKKKLVKRDVNKTKNFLEQQAEKLGCAPIRRNSVQPTFKESENTLGVPSSGKIMRRYSIGVGLADSSKNLDTVYSNDTRLPESPRRRISDFGAISPNFGFASPKEDFELMTRPMTSGDKKISVTNVNFGDTFRSLSNSGDRNDVAHATGEVLINRSDTSADTILDEVPRRPSGNRMMYRQQSME